MSEQQTTNVRFHGTILPFVICQDGCQQKSCKKGRGNTVDHNHENGFRLCCFQGAFQECISYKSQKYGAEKTEYDPDHGDDTSLLYLARVTDCHKAGQYVWLAKVTQSPSQ